MSLTLDWPILTARSQRLAAGGQHTLLSAVLDRMNPLLAKRHFIERGEAITTGAVMLTQPMRHALVIAAVNAGLMEHALGALKRMLPAEQLGECNCVWVAHVSR